MPTDSSDSSPARRHYWAPPCFFLGLGLILWGLYQLGKPYYADKDVRDDQQKVRQLDKARYVVVGASHGQGVDLERLGVEGQNLAHGGQDLFEMVYIARSAAERGPKLESVIIVLSYFSFALDNAAFERHGVNDRIGRRIQMYSAFPRLAFVPGDHAEYAKGLLYPIVTRDHFEHGFERNAGRLLRLFTDDGRPPRSGKRPRARPSEAAAEATPRAGPHASAGSPRAPAPDDAEDEVEDDSEPGDEGAVAPEPEGPSASESTDGEPKAAKGAEQKRARPDDGKVHILKNEAWYARHAAGRCRLYAGLMDNMRAHHPNLERDTFDTLDGLVRELEAKHISVVLLVPPYLPAYTSCFEPRMRRLTHGNAARLAQATGARYIDLSADAAFTTKIGLFVDSDHLRPRGKDLLAQKLAALLHVPRP